MGRGHSARSLAPAPQEALLGSSGLDALDTPSVGGFPGAPRTHPQEREAAGLQDESLTSERQAPQSSRLSASRCVSATPAYGCTWQSPGLGLRRPNFGAQEHLARLTSHLGNQNLGKLIPSPEMIQSLGFTEDQQD